MADDRPASAGRGDMSDTPRTDGKVCKCLAMCKADACGEYVDLCRKLECELAAVTQERDALRKERDTIGTVLDDVAALFFNEAEWDYADVHPCAAAAINELAAVTEERDALRKELADARRQVEAMSAPLAAAYSRFGHLDNVLEMAHDPDGTEKTNPWHACARDLWRAVKAARKAKGGGKSCQK